MTWDGGCVQRRVVLCRATVPAWRQIGTTLSMLGLARVMKRLKLVVGKESWKRKTKEREKVKMVKRKDE